MYQEKGSSHNGVRLVSKSREAFLTCPYRVPFTFFLRSPFDGQSSFPALHPVCVTLSILEHHSWADFCRLNTVDRVHSMLHAIKVANICVRVRMFVCVSLG